MIEEDNRPLSERTAASIGDSESARGGGGDGGENGREERDWWRVMSWTSPPTPAGSTVSCRCRLLSDVARLVFVYIQELVLSEMVSCLARPNDILFIKIHLVWRLSWTFSVVTFDDSPAVYKVWPRPWRRGNSARGGWPASCPRVFSISLLSSEITLVTHTTDARFGGSNYHLPTHSTRPRPFGVPLNCPDDAVVKTPVERQTTRKSYLKLHPTRTTTYQQISLFVRLSLLSSRLSIF